MGRPTQLISTREVCAILALTPRSVLRLLNDGKIRGRLMPNNRWRADRAHVEALAELTTEVHDGRAC